jgi:hypothetical protein
MFGVGAAGALTVLGWAGVSAVSGNGPLALVYRGPAACDGCSESVAALLRSSPAGFRTEYCGPDSRGTSPDTLAEAVVTPSPAAGTSTGPGEAG